MLRWDSFGGGGGTSPPPDPSDEFFANVKLLICNGDGTEGNQDMVDKGSTGHTITWLGGSQMDTGIEKFSGSPTLLVDGQSDGIRVPDHADFNGFGTQDFTIEIWCYPDGAPSNSVQRLLAKWATTGKRAYIITRNASDKFTFQTSSDGTNVDVSIVSSGTINQDVWTWLVQQREGNDYTQWIDGVRDAAPISDASSIHGGGAEELLIGIQSTSASEFKGNFGPIRVTLGNARYPGAPANIVVPVKPWPEF